MTPEQLAIKNVGKQVMIVYSLLQYDKLLLGGPCLLMTVTLVSDGAFG